MLSTFLTEYGLRFCTAKAILNPKARPTTGGRSSRPSFRPLPGGVRCIGYQVGPSLRKKSAGFIFLRLTFHKMSTLHASRNLSFFLQCITLKSHRVRHVRSCLSEKRRECTEVVTVKHSKAYRLEALLSENCASSTSFHHICMTFRNLFAAILKTAARCSKRSSRLVCKVHFTNRFKLIAR